MREPCAKYDGDTVRRRWWPTMVRPSPVPGDRWRRGAIRGGGCWFLLGGGAASSDRSGMGAAMNDSDLVTDNSLTRTQGAGHSSHVTGSHSPSSGPGGWLKKPHCPCGQPPSKVIAELAAARRNDKNNNDSPFNHSISAHSHPEALATVTCSVLVLVSTTLHPSWWPRSGVHCSPGSRRPWWPQPPG